jgi:hypothetical protein
MAMRKKRNMLQKSPTRVNKWNALGSLLAIKIIMYLNFFKFERVNFLYLKMIRLLFPVTDNSYEENKISVCFKRRAA